MTGRAQQQLPSKAASPPHSPQNDASPRPRMLGTMLPQNSLRQMRPATTRLANVGLTLFRRGLVEAPVKAEAKGPSGVASLAPKNAPPASTAATVGSLDAISEALGTETDDEDCETDEEELCEIESHSISLASRVIVVVGGAVPWGCSNRISRAVEIYWQTIKLFQQHQAKSYCYLAPIGDDVDEIEHSDQQTASIRNDLVDAGITPHHILMNCAATDSTIDSIVQLSVILKHLNISNVQIVAACGHRRRIQMCVDSIFDALSDRQVQISYVEVPDPGLAAAQRLKLEAHEQWIMRSLREPIVSAIRLVHQQSVLPGSRRRTRTASQDPNKLKKMPANPSSPRTLLEL